MWRYLAPGGLVAEVDRVGPEEPRRGEEVLGEAKLGEANLPETVLPVEERVGRVGARSRISPG